MSTTNTQHYDVIIAGARCAGAATALRGSVASAWVWYTWYWFEMELAGTSVKARIYPDDATEAPAWQLAATTTTACRSSSSAVISPAPKRPNGRW